MERKEYSVLENIVVLMIVLVIIQTFLEDFVVLIGVSWDIRKIFIVTGLVFDVFFTVEFLVRLHYALYARRALDYILHKRGWIDFTASIPLLLLNSGPAAMALLAGGGGFLAFAGVLNVLKIVKAVRIARILRLLRVLKIFKQIKYADSVMAQRHISKITSITITTFVTVILVISIVTGITKVSDSGSAVENYRKTVSMLIAQEGESLVRNIALTQKDLLIVKLNNKTVYTKYENDYYRQQFGPGDYAYVEQGNTAAFFDSREQNALFAKENLTFFIIIMALTFMFLFYYSPHFAITVTDPIHVITRGMSEKNYNFEVKEQPKYRNDDIFHLAKTYNEQFLPMKDRFDHESDLDSDIKVDDIDELFKGL